MSRKTAEYVSLEYPKVTHKLRFHKPKKRASPAPSIAGPQAGIEKKTKSFRTRDWKINPGINQTRGKKIYNRKYHVLVQGRT